MDQMEGLRSKKIMIIMMKSGEYFIWDEAE